MAAPGRKPKVFEYDEKDFDDIDFPATEPDAEVTVGTQLSAVGLELMLMKNVGHLQLRFEGTDGGTAHWNFDRLQEINRAPGLYASAATQVSTVTVSEGTQTYITTLITQSKRDGDERPLSEVYNAQNSTKSAKAS